MPAAYNTCTPQNIYGSYSQHLFLGCSVMSFTGSVGWGQQSSELTVQVVQDECPAADGSFKIYYDAALAQQTTTAADPGFDIFGGGGGPSIGAALYFRVHDFEFSGILQSWEKNDSPEGKNVYTIKIMSPTEILEGCHLILSGYQGALPYIYNIFNVYGYLESIGTACPSAPSGGFGGSDLNSRGIPVNLIKQAITVLTSTPSDYSPFGGIYYRNEDTDVGYGVISGTASSGAFSSGFNTSYSGAGTYKYFLDITELPTGPDYYRIGGTSISILDFISQVCDDAGCDYIIQLVPTGTDKVIKVKVVSRVDVPSLNAISGFIASPPTGVKVLSSSVGREARNEINSAFLMGGQVESMFEIDEGDADLLPYYGLYPNGDVIIADFANGEYNFDFNIAEMNRTMNTPLGVDTINMTESEIRMAAGGYDAWLVYIKIANTESWQQILSVFPDIDNKLRFSAEVLQDIENQNNVNARDIAPLKRLAIPGNDQADKNELDDIQKVHRFISNLASEYYGKKFIIPVGNVCVNLPSETVVPVYSYEPVSAGWHDEQAVFGMSPGSANLTFFSEEDGRVNCILKFETFDYADFENRNESDYGIIGGVLYYKAQVEPTFVFADASTFTDAYVVVSISDGLYRKVDNNGDPVPLADIFRGVFRLNDNPLAVAVFQGLFAAIGGNNIELEILGKAAFPNAAAVPLRSNTITYGPWSASFAPAGKIRIEQDESLVPWEYGSNALMDAAANSKVTEGVTNMVEGETGTINVAGYPTVGLGDVLVAGGPNVTNINCSISTGGVQTTYTMRTFTPQFGRFTKQNAERLKQAGQNANKFNRLQKLEYLKNNRPPNRPRQDNKDVTP